VAGYAKYGAQWSRIYSDPQFAGVFAASRTPIDLKDKFRNLFVKQKLPDKRAYQLLGTEKVFNNRCVVGSRGGVGLCR
jgi:hypothetical protein